MRRTSRSVKIVAHVLSVRNVSERLCRPRSDVNHATSKDPRARAFQILRSKPFIKGTLIRGDSSSSIPSQSSCFTIWSSFFVFKGGFDSCCMSKLLYTIGWIHRVGRFSFVEAQYHQAEWWEEVHYMCTSYNHSLYKSRFAH